MQHVQSKLHVMKFYRRNKSLYTFHCFICVYTNTVLHGHPQSGYNYLYNREIIRQWRVKEERTLKII